MIPTLDVGNLPQATANAAQSELPPSLKIIIIAICAIAGAALGFWVASLAGGAVSGAALGFAAVWLVAYCPTPVEEVLGSELVIPKTRESSLYTGRRVYFADELIRWMHGTQSIMLSFILATYRQTELRSLGAPALMPANKVQEFGITPLSHVYNDRPNDIQGTSYLGDAMDQTVCDYGLQNQFELSALNGIRFNPAECDLITNPFPLIFASKSKDLNPIKRYGLGTEELTGHSVENGIVGEDINHPLLLGRDIQYIYTANANIARVQAALGLFAAEVEVLDIETL